MSENKQQVYSKAEFVTRVSEALTSFLETNAEGVELLDGNVLITHVFNNPESPLCIRLTVDMLFAPPADRANEEAQS